MLSIAWWSLVRELAEYDVSIVSGTLAVVKKVGFPSEWRSSDVSRECRRVAAFAIQPRGTCLRMAASIAGTLAASSDNGALKYRSMDILLSMAGLPILVKVSILGTFDSRLRIGLSVEVN
jgi:hypothetical protein